MLEKAQDFLLLGFGGGKTRFGAAGGEGGQRARRGAALVRARRVGADVEQGAHGCRAACAYRAMERRGPEFVAGNRIGAGFDEGADGGRLRRGIPRVRAGTANGGRVNRLVAQPIRGVRVGAVAEQRPDQARSVGGGSKVERGVARVDVAGDRSEEETLGAPPRCPAAELRGGKFGGSSQQTERFALVARGDGCDEVAEGGVRVFPARHEP
jgi:hypothetical protein